MRPLIAMSFRFPVIFDRGILAFDMLSDVTRYEVMLARVSKIRDWGSSALVNSHLRCYSEVPTLRLPPVMVTLTKRRVYVSLFLARPLGVFFFSWGSTF